MLHRLAGPARWTVPGIDASLVPGADPPAWPEGLQARAEQSAPGATLYWPMYGEQPDTRTSASPAKQWYFAQSFNAPLRDVVSGVFSALQLAGTPSDYHAVLSYGRPSLTTRAARAEGQRAVEAADMIAELRHAAPPRAPRDPDPRGHQSRQHQGARSAAPPARSVRASARAGEGRDHRRD